MVAWKDATTRIGVVAAAAERPPGPDPEVPTRPNRRQFAKRRRLMIATENCHGLRTLQHRTGRASLGRGRRASDGMAQDNPRGYAPGADIRPGYAG